MSEQLSVSATESKQSTRHAPRTTLVRRQICHVVFSLLSWRR